MKKLLAFLLSAAMALTLAIPAMAAPEDAVPYCSPYEAKMQSILEEAYHHNLSESAHT